MLAQALLKQGDLELSLQALQQRVRERPSDPALRTFLFQLLCVTGDWQRALMQLQLTGELDAVNLPMVQTYRSAIACERYRLQVFAGLQAPLVLGDPPPWIALLIQSLPLTAGGANERAAVLRSEALDQAPANPGVIDGEAFAWLADADPRMGPVLEAFIKGRYYWVPMGRLQAVSIEPPSDLRDLIWAPAQLLFETGLSLPALLPARYSGTEATDDAALKLGRKTLWQERLKDDFVGLGQRMLVSDRGEHPLLEIRQIRFEAA